MDWFLYDNGLRHERVKKKMKKNLEQKYALAFLIQFKNREKHSWRSVTFSIKLQVKAYLVPG